MHVLITVDTELSPRMFQRGASIEENLASSIFGRAGKDAVGIGWQMATLDAHGLKGTFFVDPVPTLMFGDDWLRRTVAAILERGHDVQLHAHVEWLRWVQDAPVPTKQQVATNIGDLDLADQTALLSWASGRLQACGAPAPTFFRAGNFGADERTFQALASLGISLDSSLNRGIAPTVCRIQTQRDRNLPFAAGGIIEFPVSGVMESGQMFRPAQVCAMSSSEMTSALRHGAENRWPFFTVVTHSFEMLSRDRLRVNGMVARRFVQMCEWIASTAGVSTAVSPQLPELVGDAMTRTDAPTMDSPRSRTMLRKAEQLLSNLVFERQVRPA